MKQRLTLIIGVLILSTSLAGILPARPIAAQTGSVPITPANAAQVVELARFGRGMVEGATWSPDGSQLAVYGAAGVWLYDPTTLAAQPMLLAEHSVEARSGVFSADGSLFIAASDDGIVQVWDLVASQAVLSLNIDGDFGTARAAASPNGTQLVMSIGDNLRIHDVATGEVVAELENAHTNIITGLAYSPDGVAIVSCSSDKTARLWDADTLEEVAILEGHTSYVNEVVFSPDGTHVVTVSSDKSTRLWDSTTGAEVTVLEAERGNMYSAAYSPDGSVIAVGNAYGVIRLLDAATLTEQEVWEEAHDSDVLSLAFSPDGSKLVSTSDDQSIKLWDVASGKMLSEVPGYTRQVSNVALNADDTLILAGSGDGTLRIWDINGDDAQPIFMQEDGSSSSTDNLHIADFSQAGDYFAGIHGSTLRIWDTASNELLHEVGGYQLGSFRSMTFNPDGSLIAVTTYNGTVLLWDVQTGDLLQALSRHGYRATPVIFSHDGALLISGGADGTIRVWGVPAD